MDMNRITQTWTFTIFVTLVALGLLVNPTTADEPTQPSAKSDVAEDSATPSEEKPNADKKTKAETSPDDEQAVEDSKKKDQDEEFYELLKLFADTLDQVERNYVEQVSRRELMEAAIRGVLAKLDQYSNYIAPEELDGFRTGVENEFGGIGIRVGMIDGQLTVITPLVGTPAYRAGILAGDQIVKIAGETTGDLSLNEAIRRMKGKIRSTIDLTVKHAHDGSEETVTLRRETVQVETVLGVNRNEDDSWNFMLDEKIGYVRLTAFSRRTHKDLRQAVVSMTDQGMRGMILDLRFNPGGLLSSAIEVADMFLPDGRIVSTEGRNIRERSWDARKKGTLEGFDMVVLVNQYSASASEIVAASLQDHNRAVVIGQRTWGKGSVQNIIELEEGRSALKLTTASYKRPNGKNIHRFEGADENDDWGVKPNDGFSVKLSAREVRDLVDFQRDVDIVTARNNSQEEANESRPKKQDRQLEKALEYLGEKLAKR